MFISSFDYLLTPHKLRLKHSDPFAAQQLPQSINFRIEIQTLGIIFRIMEKKLRESSNFFHGHARVYTVRTSLAF
jgi:hypothetical protein